MIVKVMFLKELNKINFKNVFYVKPRFVLNVNSLLILIKDVKLLMIKYFSRLKKNLKFYLVLNVMLEFKNQEVVIIWNVINAKVKILRFFNIKKII